MNIVIQLIDTQGRKVVGEIVDGGTYDFSAGNRTLGVVPVAGAARYDFIVDAGQKRTEALAPYHIAGDWVPWKPSPGHHSVRVLAFGASPTPLADRTIGFVALGATGTPTDPLPPSNDPFANDLKPPPDRGPATIRNQVELDKLAASGGIKGQPAVIAPGAYTLTQPLRLFDGALLAAGKGGDVWLTWAGDSNSNASVIPMLGQGCTVEGVKLKCGGRDAFSMGAGSSGHVINGTYAEGANDFLNLGGSGAKNIIVANNVVPLVANYFVFASGKTTQTPTSVTVDPVEGLVVTGNTAQASTWMHLLRFHSTLNPVVRGNNLTRRVRDDMHDGTVGKIHDGGGMLFEYNRLTGTDDVTQKRPGFLGLGPLPGGDGGLKEPNPVMREHRLHAQLAGLIFRYNTLLDVHVVMFPGLKGLDFHDNTISPARGGLALYYQALQPFAKADGTIDPGDYQPYRGKVEGKVYNNKVAARPGAKKADPKHWQNMPEGVSVTHNTVEGQLVDG